MGQGRINISEDQNVITTEDGYVFAFKESRGCDGCYFKNTHLCDINAIPCYIDDRDDKKDGIFLIKKQ